MRFVIVHYHLYKNAGSTIDSILDRNFHEGTRGHIEGPLPWSTLSSSDLLDFVTKNPELQAVSSHQARLPIPRDTGIRFLPIVLLRHPIDRVRSVYQFERNQSAGSPSASTAVARNSDFKSFVEWVVGRDATGVCRNFQVLQFSTDMRDIAEARATPDDYQIARARLKALPVFGLVEFFDESLSRFRECLAPHFGELDFSYEPVNVSQLRPATLQERLEAIRSELGPALYRELLEHNALDLLLYEEAVTLFKSAGRLRMTGGLAARWRAAVCRRLSIRAG